MPYKDTKTDVYGGLSTEDQGSAVSRSAAVAAALTYPARPHSASRD